MSERHLYVSLIFFSIEFYPQLCLVLPILEMLYFTLSLFFSILSSLENKSVVSSRVRKGHSLGYMEEGRKDLGV